MFLFFISTFLLLTQGLSAKCEKEFQYFQEKHGKFYQSTEETVLRKIQFCSNFQKIEELNARVNRTWTAGVNKYSDLSWKEFKIKFGLMKPQNCSATTNGSFKSQKKNVPKAYDWRNETCGETSCVSMVKNQGNCGSCWTFSTVGALEAANAIKTKVMTLLSEQQLVDCAQGFNNNGCDGGLPSQAFEYIKWNGGLDTMETYPYVCGDGHCKPTSGVCLSGLGQTGVKVKGVHNFTSGDETSMKEAVGTLQPVSVAFEVVDDLMHYSHGVYTSKNCHDGSDTVNHAVLAVGYGTDKESKLDFWTIKNSWGCGWGNQGYFNIARGNNMCGISTCASYPEV